MMSRLYLSIFALGLTLAAVGCGKDTPATPTPAADPKFTATLSPANETTAVVGGDVTGSGTVTVTVHATKDASRQCHGSDRGLHRDAVRLSSRNGADRRAYSSQAPLASRAAWSGAWVWRRWRVTLPNGSTTFTKTAVTPTDVATAQGVLNNPAGYYFNVHTTVNTGGAARGQLVKAN